MTTSDIESLARGVQTQIRYVSPQSRLNRRFVARGVEHNTGSYETHTVTVRDARPLSDRFSLDCQGFQLFSAPSNVTDFFNRDEVDRLYPNEMAELFKSVTGASSVIPFGWMLRTSGEITRKNEKEEGPYSHQGGLQPPAGEAHVDMMPHKAEAMARMMYERYFPEGKGYHRFLSVSAWRAFSPPPQDWPLAVCDYRSVRDDEGVPNTMFIVDALPSEAEMMADIPDEENAIAAAIFSHSPAHRWWYFSNIGRDDVLMFKFHDSDRNRALRCPHTAFYDPSFENATVRNSIEFRLMGFFE